MAAEYQQMRDMLIREERDALTAVDREMESGQTKHRTLMKKFAENIDNMSKAKEDIHSLLGQSQTLAFLQVRQLWLSTHTAAFPHNVNSKRRHDTHCMILL